MRLSIALLGTIAVAVAFGGAYAIARTSGEPSLAYAKPAQVISVSRALPPIPSVADRLPLPPLAKPHRHVRRRKPAPPSPSPRHWTDPPPAPRPYIPQPPAALPAKPKPRADRSGGGDSSAPDLVTPAPTAVPTPIAPVDPDPGEVDEGDVPPEEEAGP